jgi:hypothetical protein
MMRLFLTLAACLIAGTALADSAAPAGPASGTPAAGAAPAVAGLDGAALYAQHCAA